jgi:hypothetical protein
LSAATAGIACESAKYALDVTTSDFATIMNDLNKFGVVYVIPSRAERQQ